MRITDFVRGLLLAGFIVSGIVFLMMGMSQKYSVTNPVNSTFNATFNKISDMTNLSNSIADQINGSKIQSTGVIDFFTSLSTNVYNSAKMIFGSYGLVNQMIQDIGITLNLPPYVVPTIITFILVGLIGWFLFSIFRVPA